MGIADGRLSYDERERLVETRRFLHQHPELSFEEVETSRLVAERLEHAGMVVRRGVSQTGVVGTLRGARPGPCLLLRADMDALPLQEVSTVPYRSQVSGVMHACAHDGHTAILLAVAEYLASRKESLAGIVKFCFQPAEELSGGAAGMVSEGVLEDPHVDAVFGLHLWNELPVGTVGLNNGALMASSDRFTINVRGQGGHGAMPHQGIDAIATATALVVGLQSIVSRRVSPLKPSVVSIGRMEGGTAPNVLAESVQIYGTTRALDRDTAEQLPRLVEQVTAGICGAHGAQFDFEHRPFAGPTINDPGQADIVRAIAADVVGIGMIRENVQTMAAEDVSEFLNARKGCFFFVGSGDSKGGESKPHHSPRFDIEEEALSIGAEMLIELVDRYPGEGEVSG